MDGSVKQFILDRVDLIDNNQWDEFWDDTRAVAVGEKLPFVDFYNYDNVREVVELLIECGANPLLNATYVPAGYFSGSNAKSINIPETIKIIESSAFESMCNLRGVLIPENVEEIEDYAFAQCYRLEEATILNPNCKIEYNIFSGSPINNITLMGYFNDFDYKELIWVPDRCTVKFIDGIYVKNEDEGIFCKL